METTLNKKREKRSNTTIILKELIASIIKDKPSDKNLYDYIIDSHPNILEFIVDNSKSYKPELIILGISHPHSSLQPNPFSDEEMKDISQRMRVN